PAQVLATGQKVEFVGEQTVTAGIRKVQEQFQDADIGYNSGTAGECPFAWELRLESPIAACGCAPKLQRKRANISRVIDRTNFVMLHALHDGLPRRGDSAHQESP